MDGFIFGIEDVCFKFISGFSCLNNQALYENRVQTKKIPVKTDIFIFNLMARRTGLEPATPGVTGRYSNQLSYHRASTVKDNEKESGG